MEKEKNPRFINKIGDVAMKSTASKSYLETIFKRFYFGFNHDLLL